MQISEQNKQEADKVVESIAEIIINEGTMYEHAIINRKSVLDLAKVAVQTCIDETTGFWETEITNLKAQINYLQSKL